MAMQKCRKCGHWVSEHAPKCDKCGLPISMEMIQLTEEKQRNRFDIGWSVTLIGRFFWEARLVFLAILAFLLIVFLPLMMLFNTFVR